MVWMRAFAEMLQCKFYSVRLYMQCRGPGFSQSKRSARNTRGGSGYFHASRVLCAKHRIQINYLAVIWRVAPPLPKARSVRKKHPGLLGGGSTGWASIEPWLVLISCWTIAWASICTCQPCQLTQYIDLYIHDWRYGYISCNHISGRESEPL